MALGESVPVLDCIVADVGTSKDLEPPMKAINDSEAASVKAPTREIEDRSKVRIGGAVPSFPIAKPRVANIADVGKARTR